MFDLLSEDSWAKGGGMDDRAEIYGPRGQTRADLPRGNSLLIPGDGDGLTGAIGAAAAESG